MFQENALIPYQVSPLPPGPWVVFAPHPDDETFGMGGTLILASKKGVKVTLVVLTDGSLGGKKVEQDNLVSTREAETRKVAQRLGIKSIYFWRQPDRRLALSAALADRAAELIGRIEPATVFFPSPMELHPDHRAASALVWEGLENCVGFQGNAYAYEISVQCPTNRLIDISAVTDDKVALASLYRSQTAERDYINGMLALNRTRSYTLPPEVDYAEAFFAYERVGETALLAHTLNHLRSYWPKNTLFLKEKNVREKPEGMPNTARNEAQIWFDRCRDIENSRTWRYTKPARTVATIMKAVNRYARASVRRSKDCFERLFFRQGR